MGVPEMSEGFMQSLAGCFSSCMACLWFSASGESGGCSVLLSGNPSITNGKSPFLTQSCKGRRAASSSAAV